MRNENLGKVILGNSWSIVDCYLSVVSIFWQ